MHRALFHNLLHSPMRVCIIKNCRTPHSKEELSVVNLIFFSFRRLRMPKTIKVINAIILYITIEKILIIFGINVFFVFDDFFVLDLVRTINCMFSFVFFCVHLRFTFLTFCRLSIFKTLFRLSHLVVNSHFDHYSYSRT